MSATAAAGLARLRVLFPVWHFSRVEMQDWSGYVARRGEPGDAGEPVIAERSLGALENALRRKGPQRT